MADEGKKALGDGLENGQCCVRILMATEVGEGPSKGAHESDLHLVDLVHESEESLDAANRDHIVAELRRVTSNIGDSPRCLLGELHIRAAAEGDQRNRASGLHHGHGLWRRARNDIGERPCRLEAHLLVLQVPRSPFINTKQ